jgi:hypothetical protein
VCAVPPNAGARGDAVIVDVPNSREVSAELGRRQILRLGHIGYPLPLRRYTSFGGKELAPIINEASGSAGIRNFEVLIASPFAGISWSSWSVLAHRIH